MRDFYFPRDVTQVIDISYRQLQYWDKTNFIKPSFRQKGIYRFYTPQDVILLAVAVQLRKVGYSIQRLRRMFSGLRQTLKVLPKKTSLLDLVLFFWRDHPPLILHGTLYGEFPDQFCTIVRVKEVLSSDVHEGDRPDPDAEVCEGSGGGTG